MYKNEIRRRLIRIIKKKNELSFAATGRTKHDEYIIISTPKIIAYWGAGGGEINLIDARFSVQRSGHTGFFAYPFISITYFTLYCSTIRTGIYPRRCRRAVRFTRASTCTVCGWGGGVLTISNARDKFDSKYAANFPEHYPRMSVVDRYRLWRRWSEPTPISNIRSFIYVPRRTFVENRASPSTRALLSVLKITRVKIFFT